MDTFDISEDLARKVLTVVDHGLVKGVGVAEPGKMCVEAAVCFALGLPHGDDPPCVGRAVRRYKIRLNDARWPSDAARTAERPLRSAPMWHIEGWLDRGGFTYEATAGPGGEQQETPDDEDWTGCDIRVRYRMQRSERSVLNEKLVADSFPGALRLQLEPIIEGDRDIRAPEVATARTLTEKLQALFKTGGQAMSEGVRAKLAALEHQPATQVLTAVQALIHRLETERVQMAGRLQVAYREALTALQRSERQAVDIEAQQQQIEATRAADLRDLERRRVEKVRDLEQQPNSVLAQITKYAEGKRA